MIWYCFFPNYAKNRTNTCTTTQINTVGVDRPGIVADVTRIVTDKGGNVGESRAQLLGGHFSLMMLVEIQASEMEDLHNNLQSGVGGMTTTCFDAIDPRAVEVSPKIGCKLCCFIHWVYLKNTLHLFNADSGAPNFTICL